jgi:nucleoside-diphosphate-sugar epimerase
MLAGTPPTLGPCTHDWDLLYVEDAATALAALVDARVDGPVNVASGERRALREAVLIAADAVANGVRPSFDDGRSADVPLRADVRRIRELTGWKPAVPLEDGVQQTAEYLRESRRTSPTGARP